METMDDGVYEVRICRRCKSTYWSLKALDKRKSYGHLCGDCYRARHPRPWKLKTKKGEKK